MERESYHHGNLQVDLIEEGLTLIHEEGRSNFSLRKLAKKVGVSPTACYNHFSGIEELLGAMQEYVTSKFCMALQSGADSGDEANSTINMGIAYVNFFAENPHYFTFIYESEDYKIQFSDVDVISNFEPFNIFKENSIKCLERNNIDSENITDNLIAMWAVVHGLAAMANMKGFNYTGDWSQLTRRLLMEKMNIC